jgi:hypothetical protein
MYGSWQGQFAWTGTTLLWMLASFVTGVGLTILWYWLKRNSIQVKWYEWLIGAVGMIILAIMVQNITSAGFEDFSNTIPMFVLFFGIPAVILLALAWRLVTVRLIKQRNTNAST